MSVERWERPHVDADVRIFRSMCPPEGALREDGSLDTDLLIEHGWTVTETELAPPSGWPFVPVEHPA